MNKTDFTTSEINNPSAQEGRQKQKFARIFISMHMAEIQLKHLFHIRCFKNNNASIKTLHFVCHSQCGSCNVVAHISFCYILLLLFNCGRATSNQPYTCICFQFVNFIQHLSHSIKSFGLFKNFYFPSTAAPECMLAQNNKKMKLFHTNATHMHAKTCQKKI